MRITLTALAAALCVGVFAWAQPKDAPMANQIVVMDTSEGTITLELWPDKAPKTVQNFLDYADAKQYDGLIFHRVIDRFMIQGGGFTPDMTQKPVRAQIQNEARADAKNDRGTIAMARTSDPHSATAQFYINLVDNAGLDFRAATEQGYGYCVFGKVTKGMEVVDKIGKAQTARVRGFDDVPAKPILIKSIQRADRRDK